ncbi:MAG: class I SAM-dependent methyltransferase [Woeseiaceae bacterium]|nr:class I SAM-dependent methyltransferase [Woeseiaceae bacterium]
MNSIEFWTVNNPIRALIQKYYETPRLKRLCSGQTDSVLEIGCGQGVGAKIIYDCFSPREYVGIDLDSRMIDRARKKGQGLVNARFLQGDASTLAFDDESFDLVVDYAIIHHIPNWRDALAEIHRTLRTNGEFLFEELSLDTWESGIGRPLKKILDHPYDRMFRQQEFVDELNKLGFETETYEKKPLSFHYFWGKATKKPAADGQAAESFSQALTGSRH